MNEDKMLQQRKSAPEKRPNGTRRRATAIFTVAILCIGLAVAFQLTTDIMAPLNSADAMNYPECDTDLTPELDGQGVPGLSAVIIKDGAIVCTAVAGLANIEDEVPVTAETLFLVASLSKTVTATALMQLYERGEFELDDNINDYLPFDVSVPVAPESPITFRQLLTHTASLRDNTNLFSVFTTSGADSPISLASLTEEYLTPDGEYYNRRDNFVRSAPGTMMSYSNMGIALAGYLVEEISGRAFDVYSRDRIFSRLGMSHTSWRLADIDLSRLAIPYEKSWFKFTPLEHYGQANYPDGMLRTSPVELAHFMIAYMQGGAYEGRRVLERDTVDTMLMSQTKLNPFQGLVWFSVLLDDETVWGHDGSDDGASAGMWFNREEDVGVILVANGNWHDESRIFEELFEEAEEY